MARRRDALVASAEKSLAKGKVDSALKDYQKVLEEIPGDINILNKAGDLLTRLNRNEEAIPYFTKLAEHFARDGFFLRGIAIYKKINRLDPSRLDVYERLAELYAKQGLTTEAKSQYQVLADYHAKNDNAVGAIGIYQKMAQTDPSNIQPHVKLADLYSQARRKIDALKEYAVVAGLLRERGALDESIQVYEKALQMAPDNAEILRAFVPILLESGRAREARDVLRRALETTPRSIPLFLLSAEAALAENDVRDAQEWLSKAQSIESSGAEVLALALKVRQAGSTTTLSFEAAAVLADQAMRRGEAKKALSILAPLAEANPGREDVLSRVIQVAEAAGDTQTVIRWRSALVDAHKSMGRIGDAATGLRALLQLVPDSAEYRTRLAQLELPAPPVAGASEGEFILELEDDQLVHEPGSTGPVPNAVRRLSQPRETDLEVETALPTDQFQVPVEPAAFPSEAESIELSCDPLSTVEQPVPVPEPEAPAAEVLAPDAIESALAEADVFRKYSLYDKAVDHLRGILKRAPDTLPLREKLFELALEGGRKNVAMAEAERLKSLYRTEGRDDRVLAIDALLVERTSAEMGEASESHPGLPALLRETLPRARPARPHVFPGAPPAPAAPVPLAEPSEPSGPAEPPADELLEIDFCLEQGMVVDASERLQALERRFPGHAQLARRRMRLEGGAAEDARPALRDILSEDFESVLDPELGRALTDEMARGAESAPPATPVQGPPAPPLDESSLFSDEQEFFNFAGELQTEMKQETGAPAVPEVSGGDVPLEEIFREFKKGVEQQLSPEDYETHYNLGIAYKEMSLTDEAISEFQRAAKSPQYAVECCSMLGLCFLEKGLPQLAVKWYRKGLDTPGIREEDRLGLQYDLANLYADLGDRENAYQTFLEIYGSNASFRDVGERLKELAPA
jgi:tetratricopeptide (TPR) repeat protein